MNSLQWMLVPAGMLILLKWTGLLSLAWVMHGLLREHHARWRVILWRSVLCFALILPAIHFFPLFKIPVRETSKAAPLLTQLLESTPAKNRAEPIRRSPSSLSRKNNQPIIVPRTSVTSDVKIYEKPLSWEKILVAIWAFGFLCGTVRLLRLQFELVRLRKEAAVAGNSLQAQLRTIQTSLGSRRKVEIQISDFISSPFACGLLRPTILLPGKLTGKLSDGEVSALLSHEIAHLRQNDLVWCIGWRWMKAIFWFHPLVWKIPAAHNLACEQEADRIASDELKDDGFYGQLLAQLALRVITLQPVETCLTLNGASQITRRLRHLSRSAKKIWNWKYSVAAFGMSVTLLFVTAGWGFSKINAAEPKKRAAMEFKEVLVIVQDENGKPVEGATIEPYALRVKGPDWASHYGWNTNLYGRPRVTTDGEGKALVKYPIVAFPEEKLITGLISFTLDHPDFAPSLGDARVDETNKPIQLIHGISFEVSGYAGKNHEPVTEIRAILGGDREPKAKDWQKRENGILTYTRLAPGPHMVQLMGKLPSGEIVYSEAIPFTGEKGKPCKFTLEMKPGIRLEGRLDDKVLRPVKNGRAVISVRPKEFPATAVPEDLAALEGKYGRFHFWISFRPIAADGSFVFESIPPGEVDVIVIGDGFVSRNGAEAKNRIDSKLVAGPRIGVPQDFLLTAPITTIQIVTESTATLEVTAKTEWGKPIQGVTVYANPNLMRIRTGIFGAVKHSDEEPFRVVTTLPEMPYSGVTDKNGVTVLPNLPTITRFLEVEHPQFEVPLGMGDRLVRLELSPGKTEKLKLILQPKGKQFIGETH